jgi:glycosyltransferase involved in cell wall biosynthesis
MASRTVVFIDDAHTFGGAQIALGATVAALLSETEDTIVCVCTARTWTAIQTIAGASERLHFVEAPPAYPLNLFRFPVRIPPYLRLLRRLREAHPSPIWWLNLPDIEFGLAPLIALRAMGEWPRTYLHGTTRFSPYYAAASFPRRALSRIRDFVADRLLIGLHRQVTLPSRASQQELRERLPRSGLPLLDFLYPAMLVDLESISAPMDASQSPARPLNLWMIGAVVQVHKNNRLALHVLQHLRGRGYTVTLTVAGIGFDLPAFQSEAEALGIGQFITYLGWIGNPCAAAPKDAVVMIPSFHETLNMVAREAMHNGLRLVVSPIPVFREWIPDVFIAASFSVQDFSDRILDVLAIPSESVAVLYTATLQPFSREAFVEGFLIRSGPVQRQ